MSLDQFLPEIIGCNKCGAPECGVCRYCKKTIICGITCVSCGSANELNGWEYNGVRH